MGIGGISIWQLLIILAIVIMLFGTKRLRNVGSDLGSAVKGFRQSMQDDQSGDNKGEDKDVDKDAIEPAGETDSAAAEQGHSKEK
ncbi:MAG: Sec-independent protein translocase subunit TatA [Parahaliea sp.]